tara:strand:+ start:16397 stop:16699 length:303 start_codon:yes stop_codon:yes gene_type:complete
MDFEVKVDKIKGIVEVIVELSPRRLAKQPKVQFSERDVRKRLVKENPKLKVGELISGKNTKVNNYNSLSGKWVYKLLVDKPKPVVPRKVKKQTPSKYQKK